MVAVVWVAWIVRGGLTMGKISKQEILKLEDRIATGRTTAADVDLMLRIIEQIVFECTGNYNLPGKALK